MKPIEIKQALHDAGIVSLYGGTKWESHYDPQSATYPHHVDVRHGNGTGAHVARRDWNRCSAFVTDEYGATSIDEALCDCHKGEWLKEPAPWLAPLLQLLDNAE